MRRPRESNPALAAQLRSKNRPVSQIPGNSPPANFHTPPTFVLANPILTYLQKKRIGSALAHSSTVRTKTLNGKSLDPGLGLPLPRKPCRPNLHGLPLRMRRAPALPRIHQQIPKPPSSTPIPQTYPQKPNLIPPPHRKRGEPLIERLHVSGRITPQWLVQTECGDNGCLSHFMIQSAERQVWSLQACLRGVTRTARLPAGPPSSPAARECNKPPQQPLRTRSVPQ